MLNIYNFTINITVLESQLENCLNVEKNESFDEFSISYFENI